MAVQLRSNAQSEENERAEIKRLVLQANKDLDLAGSAAAAAAPSGGRGSRGAHQPRFKPAAAPGGYYARGGGSGSSAASPGRGRGRSTEGGRARGGGGRRYSAKQGQGFPA